MEPLIKDRGRGPEIVGTRITVYDVLDYLNNGWQASAIAAFLGVRTEQVEAAIRYVDEHREPVMVEYRKMLERAARGNPAEVEAKLAVGRERLRALRESLAGREVPPLTEAGHAGDRGGR